MSSPLIVTAWRGHEHFAKWLVHEVQPKVIVELGVDYGFSSFTFATPGIGQVYGVDSFEGDPEAGHRDTYNDVMKRRDELGIKNLELIRGYFSDVAKTWDKAIDILHIDGRHRYEDVKEDFEMWSKFVHPGGVILLHDTCVDKEPYQVNRFFAEITLPKTNFEFSNGLGIVSTDQAIISKIDQVFHNKFVTSAPIKLLKRISRKIKRTISPEKF
ncbi:MAG: class I SAM-dependent methyltransferase [Armatimonadota bacterium]